MSGVCFTCAQESAHIHEHHVTMQARTGEQGPLVDLCGTCHTEIHAIANARIAKLRGGKTKVNTEWSHQRHAQELYNAEMLIRALVRILLTDTSGKRLPIKASLDIPFEINEGLELLKKQLGLKSKAETILFCCERVIIRMVTHNVNSGKPVKERRKNG